jgi:hypothetical protein
MTFLVHFDDGHQILIEGGGQMAHATATTADLDTANFFASIGGVKNVERRDGQDARCQRALFQKGTTSQFGVHVECKPVRQIEYTNKLTNIAIIAQQKH